MKIQNLSEHYLSIKLPTFEFSNIEISGDWISELTSTFSDSHHPITFVDKATTSISFRDNKYTWLVIAIFEPRTWILLFSADQATFPLLISLLPFTIVNVFIVRIGRLWCQSAITMFSVISPLSTVDIWAAPLNFCQCTKTLSFASDKRALVEISILKVKLWFIYLTRLFTIGPEVRLWGQIWMKPKREIVGILHPADQEFDVEKFVIRTFQNILTCLLS